MTPDPIISELRAHSAPLTDRIATLLECEHGDLYSSLLLMPAFEEQVREVIGNNAYAALRKTAGPWSARSEPLEKPSWILLPVLLPQPEPVEQSALDAAMRCAGRVAESISAGVRHLYSEIHRQCVDNPALLFEIWKDADPLYLAATSHFQCSQRERIQAAAREHIERTLRLLARSEWLPSPFSENSETDINLVRAEARVAMVQKWHSFIENAEHILRGIDELTSGGKIVTSRASPVSVAQNSYGFPNIAYAKSALHQAQAHAYVATGHLNLMPDISSLRLSQKAFRIPWSIGVRKIAKNPLDITFGNDSRCCVKVPRTLDRMDCGASVPVYLACENTFLYGVYRIREGQEKRIGLVLAHSGIETTSPRERIFVCNSLELDRLAIPGGTKALGHITDYVEQALEQEASRLAYKGCVMSAHMHNKAAHVSKRKSNRYFGTFNFRGIGRDFASNVLVRTDDGGWKGPIGACYVIWSATNST